MAGKITVVATITPQTGKENEVKEILMGMVSPSRSEPGCLRYDLYNVEMPEPGFVLIEAYRDQAAVEAHRATAHYGAYRARITDLLGAAIRVQVLQEMDAA